jgi:hypothetical protein
MNTQFNCIILRQESSLVDLEVDADITLNRVQDYEADRTDPVSFLWRSVAHPCNALRCVVCAET